MTTNPLLPVGNGSMTLDSIQNRLGEITTECRRLATHSTLTRAQEAQLESLQAERLDLSRAIRANELDAIRAAATAGHHLEGGATGMSGLPGTDQGAPRHAGNTDRDRARRTLDQLRSVPDEGRERLTRTFERAEAAHDGGQELDSLSRWLLATSSPHYARAVSKLFRDPENGHREFDRDELAAYQSAKLAQRAMSIGTDSAGGFLLPTHLDPSILLSNTGVIDPIRQLARVETIATDTWNGISSAGVTASWDAEGVEVSDDSPTLAQPTVPTHKGAAFIAASIEAAMDTNIEAQVAALFIDAKQRLEGTAFLDGTGSGQPTGVITALAAGQKVATATMDALVVGDVVKPQNALPPRWQANAAHIANLTTINAIAAFETSAGGGLRFPEVANDRLLRKPFLEHSGMDTAGATATAGNDSVLLYGDFKQYLIADRVGTTVEYIPHLFHTTTNRPSGQRGWYMFWRTGGDVLIDDAFRLLTA